MDNALTIYVSIQTVRNAHLFLTTSSGGKPRNSLRRLWEDVKTQTRIV
jgi:hypothetical protein